MTEITIQSIAAKLTNGDHAFSDLLPAEQAFAAEILRPKDGQAFSGRARLLLQDRWLILSADQLPVIEQFNEVSAPFGALVRLHPDSGEYLLTANLLTDCREGEPYFPLRPILLTSKMKWVDPIAWLPPPNEEDEFEDYENEEPTGDLSNEA